MGSPQAHTLYAHIHTQRATSRESSGRMMIIATKHWCRADNVMCIQAYTHSRTWRKYCIFGRVIWSLIICHMLVNIRKCHSSEEHMMCSVWFTACGNPRVHYRADKLNVILRKTTATHTHTHIYIYRPTYNHERLIDLFTRTGIMHINVDLQICYLYG